MIKTNKQVTIRSANKNDVEILVNWWSSGEVMAHAGFPNGIKTDSIKLTNRIENYNKDNHPKNQILIISLENDYRIGEMNYHGTDEDIYEIGIKICEIKEQSKGYGEIAIKLLIDYIKNDLKGKKIILDTNLNNKGSQKFYKRLGFSQVGIRKDCWTDQLGNLQSAVDFELDLCISYIK